MRNYRDRVLGMLGNRIWELMHGNLGVLNLGLESHVSRGSDCGWLKDRIRPAYLIEPQHLFLCRDY